MRVAIFSESPSDEAALRELVGTLLGQPLEPVSLNLRSRGWPAVLKELSAVIRELWLNSRAEALVVSVDTDYSPVHLATHPAVTSDCRLCQLKQEAGTTLERLVMAHPGKETLFRWAAAAASPAVEAWLLHGTPHALTEASWQAVLLTNPSRYDVRQRVKELKRQVYGSPQPGEAAAIAMATREARRLATDLPGLRLSFPGGFGTMASAVESWPAAPISSASVPPPEA